MVMTSLVWDMYLRIRGSYLDNKPLVCWSFLIGNIGLGNKFQKSCVIRNQIFWVPYSKNIIAKTQVSGIAIMVCGEGAHA